MSSSRQRRETTGVFFDLTRGPATPGTTDVDVAGRRLRVVLSSCNAKRGKEPRHSLRSDSCRYRESRRARKAFRDATERYDNAASVGYPGASGDDRHGLIGTRYRVIELSWRAVGQPKSLRYASSERILVARDSVLGRTQQEKANSCYPQLESLPSSPRLRCIPRACRSTPGHSSWPRPASGSDFRLITAGRSELYV